jgi:hypothetical protein
MTEKDAIKYPIQSIISMQLLNKVKSIVSPLFGAKRSPDWYSTRNQFVKNNPHCAFCGTEKKLEVHHVIPVHVRPEMELEESNLITLCEPDHFRIGHFCNWNNYNLTVKNDCEIFYKRILDSKTDINQPI